ncbi:MAG: YggT family protein [Patescibacteria group bacterium]|nr:YggT family protein [Patescibacteria group bacterium]
MNDNIVSKRRSGIVSQRVNSDKSTSLIERLVGTDNIVDNVSQGIYFLFSILEGLLILRFILKLSAANPYNNFVGWIYSTTYPLVAIFEGVFPSPSADGATIEIPSLVAMVILILVIYAIVGFLKIANSNLIKSS